MGGMRGYRKNRRPGNRPMTDGEMRVVDRAKDGVCIACLIRSLDGKMSKGLVQRGHEWDHHKSGNLRIGHLYGTALCLWHHRRRILFEDRSFNWHLQTLGPSRLDGGKLFTGAYGDDTFLALVQLRRLFPHGDIDVTKGREELDRAIELALTEGVNRSSIIETFDPEPIT